jgi:nitrite reductase/ring-hydroxylating ferredoxin subunit
MPVAAKSSDVPNFGKKLVEVNGQQILLVNIKGEFYACESECPHQGAPLSGAIVKEGPVLTCQRHGYRFSLVTGECAEHPECRLQLFKTRVVGDEILIDMD